MTTAETPNRTAAADLESIGELWVMPRLAERRDAPFLIMINAIGAMPHALEELQKTFVRFGPTADNVLLLIKAPGSLDETREWLEWETIHNLLPAGTDVQIEYAPDWADDSSVAPEYEHETRRLSEIEKEIDRLFWNARDEAFEDGMESGLAQQLELYVRERGNDVVEVLQALSRAARVSPSILAEALSAIGRIDHPATQESRFGLLANSLFHSSVQVRDAAGLGLAVLGDRRAVLYLRRAVEREPSKNVKRQLDRVASYLEP